MPLVYRNGQWVSLETAWADEWSEEQQHPKNTTHVHVPPPPKGTRISSAEPQDPNEWLTLPNGDRQMRRDLQTRRRQLFKAHAEDKIDLASFKDELEQVDMILGGETFPEPPA
jgi:hypothetical protein